MEESFVKYELVGTGDCARVRRTSFVSPRDVIVDVTSDRIRVLPKPVPKVSDDKFELVPEGDMFRVVALRTIGRHGVPQGKRGGLVSHRDGLAQKGDCWIDEGVTVLDRSCVYDDAYVYGSTVVDGGARIGGRAYVSSCELRGQISVGDDANLAHCKVTGSVNLAGSVAIADSLIAPAFGQVVSLRGGNFDLAHLTGFYEALALLTRHGVLTVYRGQGGHLVGNIGCQKFDIPEGLLNIARGFSATDVEKSMIDGFFTMVHAAQKYWTPPTQEEVQS